MRIDGSSGATLNVLLQAAQGERVTVELVDLSVATGLLADVDNQMNLSLSDVAYSTKRDGKAKSARSQPTDVVRSDGPADAVARFHALYETVQHPSVSIGAKSIAAIHFPPHLDPLQRLNEQLAATLRVPVRADNVIASSQKRTSKKHLHPNVHINPSSSSSS
ncbi:lsm10, U7 small nuclear RNA associated [Sorochytrium milnesiophthora]